MRRIRRSSKKPESGSTTGEEDEPIPNSVQGAVAGVGGLDRSEEPEGLRGENVPELSEERLEFILVVEPPGTDRLPDGGVRSRTEPL